MLRRDTILKVRDVFLPKCRLLERSSGFQTLKGGGDKKKKTKSYMQQHLLFEGFSKDGMPPRVRASAPVKHTGLLSKISLN